MMNTRQAAEYLGISHYYLRNMRQLMHNHEGPQHYLGFDRGGKVKVCYYTKEALDEWNRNHKRRKKNENV